MNCKENQLVRYVGSNPFNRPNIYGWVGKTVKFVPSDGINGCGWEVAPPLPGGTRLDHRFRGVYTGQLVADVSLRPIRPGETPEESTEAMKRLHDTTVPAKKKEPVVRPYEWEEL